MSVQPHVSNTVIRDNIRGNRLIHVSDPIIKIIDTAEFQRLRGIKQLGLTSYVFPTAEHSRFAHSLGVYATARESFGMLRRKAEPCMITVPGLRFDDASELDFCVAAMCHDIGHTAFSHVLESVLLPDGMRRHEDCTTALLTATGSLREVIEDIADLDAVLLLISREHPNKALSSLISGPFDVDRCDYLIRDSTMTGVDYGYFDFPWLLHSLSIDINNLQQPILILDGPRGLDALRQFLAARRYMYRQIYFHPAIRSAQLLLKAIFERITDISLGDMLVTQAPFGLRPFLRRQPISLGDFLETTDAEILQLIKLLAREAADPTLRTLAEMFTRREFPKCVLDSAKSHAPFERTHGLLDAYEHPDGIEATQLPLWRDQNPVRVVEFEEECRELVKTRLINTGRPPDLAQYLVSADRVTFRSDPPTDFMFSYNGSNVPLEDIDHDAVGYDLPRLMESFQMFRFYAPAEFKEALRGLANRRRNSPSEVEP
jgi:HD superfamily phosphohydrolase